VSELYTVGSRFTTRYFLEYLVVNRIVVKRVLFKWFKLRWVHGPNKLVKIFYNLQYFFKLRHTILIYWIRYIENYTDNWKKYQSNHFSFCWRSPRLWFRRHQERMWRQLFYFFSVFLMDVMGGKITVNLRELH